MVCFDDVKLLLQTLLTEGMNYAFIRYLAIMGFEGSINNKTAVTINGKLYKTIYVCMHIYQ